MPTSGNERVFDLLMDLAERITRIEQMLKSKIDSDNLSITSINSRFAEHEKRILENERWRYKMIGVSGAISVILTTIVKLIIQIW